MKRLVQMVVSLAIMLVVCVPTSASAIETCMSVRIIQISPDHDGTNVVVVVNEDGDKFMFSDIDWPVWKGEKMFMCINLKYGKGNFWTMDDKTPYLAEKSRPNKKE